MRVSLSSWRGLIPDFTFVGLQQYIELMSDRRFHIDVRNTAIFTVIFLIACLAIGLFLAVLLDQRLRGENLFRSIYLFPMAISFIVTGVIWRWLMNSATGTRISGLNLLFQNLGLDALISKWTSRPIRRGASPSSSSRRCGRCPASPWHSIWVGCGPSRTTCARRPGWTAPPRSRPSATSCCRCFSR